MDLTPYHYLALSLLLLVGLGVLEVVSRVTRLPKVVIRKTGHVGLALVIAGAALLWHTELFITIGFGFTLVALVLRQLPLKSLGAFKSSSYGDVLFPLGVGIAAMISPTDISFVLIMLIVGLADTAAFIVGKHIPSKKIYGPKTIAGTAAFAVVSCSILLIGAQPIAVALIGAVVLAAIELVSGHGSDNLTIPVAASLLLSVTTFF